MLIATATIDGLAIRFGRTSATNDERPLLLFNGIGASPGADGAVRGGNAV
jgi:hypothetical protein